MPNPAFVSEQPIATGVVSGGTYIFNNPSNSLTAGNVIILRVASYQSGGGVTGKPTSVIDNETIPNTFTYLGGLDPSVASACRVDLYASPPLAQSHAAGAYNVTVTPASGQLTGAEVGGVLLECSGFGTGVAVDTIGYATLAASTASISVTTAATSQQAVELVLAWLHFNDSNNPDGIAIPTGTGTWIDDGIVANASIALAIGAARQFTAATGTAYTATWSGLDTTTNNGGTALVAALYPASSAAPFVSMMGQIWL